MDKLPKYIVYDDCGEKSLWVLIEYKNKYNERCVLWMPANEKAWKHALGYSNLSVLFFKYDETIRHINNVYTTSNNKVYYE